MTRQDSYWGNVPRYYLFNALTSGTLYLPIWIVFLQGRGMTLGQIGFLDALSFVAVAVAEVPTGVVADTYGRKASLILGALLHGLAMFALLAGVLSPLFLLGYLIWGVSLTFFSGAGDAFLYDSLKADRLDETYIRVASRNLAVIQAVSGVAGLLGGFLAVWDVRLCFVASGVLMLAAAVVGTTFREPPRDDAPQMARPEYWETLRVGVRVASASSRVRSVILLGAIISCFSILMTVSLLQPYMDEAGLPVWSFGAVLLGIRGGSMLGSWLAPVAAGRISREILLLVVPVSIVALQLLLWAIDSAPAVALFAAVGCMTAIIRPILSAMLNDAIPGAQRATVISLQSLVFTTMLAIVQPGLFKIAGRFGTDVAIGVSGMLMACLVAPLLARLHRSTEAVTGRGVTISTIPE